VFDGRADLRNRIKQKKNKQREAVCSNPYMSEDFHLLVLDVRRDGVLLRVLLLLLLLLLFLLQF